MTASPHTAALSTLTERVGDTERDALIAELNGHHVHGRLSSEELDRRQGLALVAVTRYDLLLLVNDLPRAELPAERPRPAPALREAGWVLAKRGADVALTASPVVGTAWVFAVTFQYSGLEGGLATGLASGAVGYATHVVRSWLKRR